MGDGIVMVDFRVYNAIVCLACGWFFHYQTLLGSGHGHLFILLLVGKWLTIKSKSFHDPLTCALEPLCQVNLSKCGSMP